MRSNAESYVRGEGMHLTLNCGLRTPAVSNHLGKCLWSVCKFSLFACDHGLPFPFLRSRDRAAAHAGGAAAHARGATGHAVWANAHAAAPGHAQPAAPGAAIRAQAPHSEMVKTETLLARANFVQRALADGLPNGYRLIQGLDPKNSSWLAE